MKPIRRALRRKRTSGSILLVEAAIMAVIGVGIFLAFFFFRSRSESIDQADCQVVNNGTPCASAAVTPQVTPAQGGGRRGEFDYPVPGEGGF